MKTARVVPVVIGAIVLVGGSVFAHHGTAISYDASKVITVSGTVTEFVWANPHGQLHWDVKDEKGNVVNWGGELHSIGLMTRAGWNKNIVHVGDEVTVSGHPSRAGTPYIVVTVINLNGKEYFRDLPEQGQAQGQ
jgi:hypothetical protein